MSKWNGRRGFDYFVDKYDSYLEDYADEYYDENEQYNYNRTPQQIDRFKKLNKYTGAPRGNRTDIIESNYMYGIPTQSRQRYQGTIEFSAVPGQGGLNPNRRPLGDQTMMVSDTSLANTSNPHLLKLIETQQMQIDQSQTYQNEIDRRMDFIDNQMNELANKIDNVTKIINNTNTLTFKNNDTYTSTLDTNVNNNSNYQNQYNTSSTNINTTNSHSIIENNKQNYPISVNEPSKVEDNAKVVVDNKNEKNSKKKKNSTLVIVGFIIWALIIVAVIVVSVLLFLGIIKF